MNGSDHGKSDGARFGDRAGMAGHIDYWLRDTLASNYNGVLAEPLPEAWVRLIRCAPTGETER
jgi:hypothetical protein